MAWTATLINEIVLEEGREIQRSLIKVITKVQMSFSGQMSRKANLEHLVSTRKSDGRRARARQSRLNC